MRRKTPTECIISIMNEIKILALGLLLPFLGTAAGAFCVFFMKKEISSRMESALSAFASGIMMSASVWSLLLPSIERANGSVFPAATGFLAGTAFLLLMDKTVPHFHSASNHSEGLHAKFRREAMLFFAVTLHNIPEGIAVGAVFAASAQMGLAGAFALSAGIALQNFPEGAIVSMPLKNRLGTPRAFLFGVLSGAVELGRIFQNVAVDFAVRGRRDGLRHRGGTFARSQARLL